MVSTILTIITFILLGVSLVCFLLKSEAAKKAAIAEFEGLLAALQKANDAVGMTTYLREQLLK